MFELRPYQVESLDAFYKHCLDSRGAALIVLPTGGGKSLVIAQVCKDYLETFGPTTSILVATHIRELIKQDYDELKELWPEAPVGIHSAGMKSRDTTSQIIIGGVQSLIGRIPELGHVDMMIIDEAHLVPHSDDTRYRKLIAGLRIANPHMRVLGLTATAFRLDSGRLDRGPNALFEKIVHEVPVRKLIEDGYLCKLISKATVQKLDVSGVGTIAGEFNQKQLEIAVDQDWITRGACKEIIEFGAERKSWLVFCVSIDHAHHVADTLTEMGVAGVGVVTSKTHKDERNALTAGFKEGRMRCLVSVNVIATGFNAKNADMIALLRPTKSAGLFLQQVGRGLRTVDGKENCLILDFAGLVKRHGPIDTITADTAERDSRGEGDKCKVCPQCASQWPHGTLECLDCGYVWPVKKKEEATSHDATADAVNSVLSTAEQNAPKWAKVDFMTCHVHVKYGGTTRTMRVDYRCGLLTYSEWICLEHDGYALARAHEWWRVHGNWPPPNTVPQGVDRYEAGELKCPIEIQIFREGQYWRIKRRRFGEVKEHL